MPKQPTEIELEISRLSDQGLGGGTHNERPVWVRNALPGETVKARILKRRGGKRFADGQPLIGMHADRVTPPCPYFPRCGGCATHHLSPEAQLRHKQQQLQDQLAAQAVEPLAWRQPVALLRLGYRRKARLGVRVVGDQVLVGFRESFSNRVARLDYCLTLTPELSRLIGPLKTAIGQMSDPRTVPQIELAQGDTGCAVIVRHLQPLTGDEEVLWQGFEHQWGVSVLMQSKGYDTLRPIKQGQDQLPLLGYQIPEYGISMGFYPHHFTQVNALMNRELIRTVMGYLGDVRGQVVVDMFCGIGNFTLPLARAGALAVGIEASAEAVAMGQHNAVANRLEQVSAFFAADLYGPGGAMPDADAPGSTSDNPGAPDQAEASSHQQDSDDASDFPIESHFRHFGDAPQALVLDPPRSGAGPNLEGWARLPSLSRIVYVSCNPQTFAADAKRLQHCGYNLNQVGVYDMFPGTAHVETVGLFVRKQA